MIRRLIDLMLASLIAIAFITTIGAFFIPPITAIMFGFMAAAAITTVFSLVALKVGFNAPVFSNSGIQKPTLESPNLDDYDLENVRLFSEAKEIKDTRRIIERITDSHHIQEMEQQIDEIMEDLSEEKALEAYLQKMRQTPFISPHLLYFGKSHLRHVDEHDIGNAFNRQNQQNQPQASANTKDIDANEEREKDNSDRYFPQ